MPKAEVVKQIPWLTGEHSLANMLPKLVQKPLLKMDKVTEYMQRKGFTLHSIHGSFGDPYKLIYMDEDGINVEVYPRTNEFELKSQLHGDMLVIASLGPCGPFVDKKDGPKYRQFPKMLERFKKALGT